MKTLLDYKSFEGKLVKATSANDYSEIKGRCLSVRECIEDYTTGALGIRYLADIERGGVVKVGLASTIEVIPANDGTLRQEPRQ